VSASEIAEMTAHGTELPIPDVTVSVAIGGTADRDQPHSISSIYEDTARSFEQLSAELPAYLVRIRPKGRSTLPPHRVRCARRGVRPSARLYAEPQAPHALPEAKMQKRRFVAATGDHALDRDDS
jgi:hypothetical protein